MYLPATTDPREKQQNEDAEVNLDLNEKNEDQDAAYQRDEDEGEPDNFSEDMD